MHMKILGVVASSHTVHIVYFEILATGAAISFQVLSVVWGGHRLGSVTSYMLTKLHLPFLCGLGGNMPSSRCCSHTSALSDEFTACLALSQATLKSQLPIPSGLLWCLFPSLTSLLADFPYFQKHECKSVSFMKDCSPVV